jgi:hypothetical protein
MDDKIDLIVLSTMAGCIARLAAVQEKASDKGMKDIVHDAALICLTLMAPQEDEKRDVLVSFDGGKMQ